jgi:hypothetical protein
MAKRPKPKAKANGIVPALQQADDPPAQRIKRNAQGQWVKGYSGYIGTDAARARRQLNASTLAGMQWAYDKYGKQAIEKVAKTQPAIFLKMLVLLVPRELEVTHTGGIKGLSDEQIEGAIETIKGMLARRAGDDAKLIEGEEAVSPDKP